MEQETIAAISTPMGEGGVSMIRVSGDKAVPVVETVFSSRAPLSKVNTHTVHYGYIRDPLTGENVEEVLVTVMRAPRSFTREDVVEVSCHGGLVSVKKVLDLILQAGARLSEPGEFTKRAFLNGRIDLSQAEAVMDLIRSKSDQAFQVARKQAEGLLSKRVKELRQKLVELMAHIEVNIDYPEHDVESMTNQHIQQQCEQAVEQIQGLLKTAKQGKILREGIVTVIVGRPNVGKSSLLNELAQENRAIVTDIPGTTRDVIEEYVTVNGIPLRLMDTAGIRETTDLVEKIGVERSRSALAEADLILFLLNFNDELHEDEEKLLQELQDWKQQLLVVVNKTDLPQRLNTQQLAKYIPENRIVLVSVKEEKNLAGLEEAISSIFFQGELESMDMTYVSNARHIDELNKAKAALLEALEANQQWVPIDMLQIDIRNAWEHLGEIIGDAVSESLIDQIFSQFCLGK